MKLVEITKAFEKGLDHLLGAYSEQQPLSEHPQLKDLGAKLNIQIVTAAESNLPSLSFGACDKVHEQFAADLLTSELNIYPPEIIHASKVERIIACNSLSVEGRTIQGLAQMGLFVVDTIFLETSRITRDWEYGRLSLHHELFHAIDYHDDLSHYVDLSWRHLNKEGFDYDYGLFKGYNEVSDKPGFLTTYSMSCAWEEKAEVYAHLIVKTSDTERRAETDPVLRRKIERMKELLFHFSPHFSDEFWQMRREESERLVARTHHEWLDLTRSEIAVRKTLELGAEAHAFRISSESQNGTKIWRLQRVGTDGGALGPQRVFYTFNKLSSCLRRLKVQEVVNKQSFQQPTTVHGVATSKTLKSLSL